MYVLRWHMSEIIDFHKIVIGSCKFMRHAIFWQIYLCARFDWFTRYIMSIIVSNCQHCDEQQFQTLSCTCTLYDFLSSKVRCIHIRALLLDRILALDKIHARLAYIVLIYLNIFTQSIAITARVLNFAKCFIKNA